MYEPQKNFRGGSRASLESDQNQRFRIFATILAGALITAPTRFPRVFSVLFAYVDVVVVLSTVVTAEDFATDRFRCNEHPFGPQVDDTERNRLTLLGGMETTFSVLVGGIAATSGTGKPWMTESVGVAIAVEAETCGEEFS